MRSVAETLVQIAWLWTADHVMHEERRPEFLEAFHFRDSPTHSCRASESDCRTVDQHQAQLTVIDRLLGIIPRFTGLAWRPRP